QSPLRTRRDLEEIRFAPTELAPRSLDRTTPSLDYSAPPPSGGELFRDELLQLHHIRRKLANTFGRFLRRHRIIIHQVPQLLLIQVRSFYLSRFRHLRAQCPFHGLRRFR